MDDSENLTPGREEISSYKTFDNLVTSSARTNAIRSCRPISDDTNLTSFIFEPLKICGKHNKNQKHLFKQIHVLHSSLASRRVPGPLGASKMGLDGLQGPPIQHGIKAVIFSLIFGKGQKSSEPTFSIIFGSSASVQMVKEEPFALVLSHLFASIT